MQDMAEKGIKETLYPICEKEFIEGNISQKELAQNYGISEQTISDWSQWGNWKQRREEYKSSAKNSLEQLKKLLSEKIALILKTDVEDLDQQGVNQIIKLQRAISELEDKNTLGHTMQALYEFFSFLRGKDFGLAKQLKSYIEEFLTGLRAKL